MLSGVLIGCGWIARRRMQYTLHVFRQIVFNALIKLLEFVEQHEIEILIIVKARSEGLLCKILESFGGFRKS